jgi:hypothetical protein
VRQRRAWINSTPPPRPVRPLLEEPYREIANWHVGGRPFEASPGNPELAAAGRALSARRDLFLDQFERSDRDEDLRAVALVEARLADNAGERKDLPAAGRWIGQALDHADLLVARTKATLDSDQLAVLLLAGELGTRAHTPIPFDLSKRLRQACARIGERHDAAWRGYERWFEIYLTLMASPASR